MRFLNFFPALFPLLISQGHASTLVRRESNNKCTDLHATSNNGDRKIAIVIDSSGSMLDSDPTDLRLTAASNVINSWLIPKSKATNKKPADLVTVIDFSDEATLDYALGDPGAANASLSNIGSFGGTLIASGVEMAIEQLTGSGTGATEKRSGILVFTDGEVSAIILDTVVLCFAYTR
jgi:Mg-chelatase subunit ChlD